jgi:TctA family transporter
MVALEGATIVGGFFMFFLILWLLMFGVFVFLFVIWIIMLIDVIQRKFKQENDKVMWILIVVLAGFIGAIIYYFMIKRPNKH